MVTKKTLLTALLLFILLASCSTETKEAKTEEFNEQKTQEFKTGPEPVTNMNTKIMIETNLGSIKVQLFDDKVPATAGNFKSLVEKKFYDGTVFHRVIKDFMIQGGDPEGTGMGGPGYEIKDEFHPSLKHNKKGLLSMANSGPNTGGSQFFITLVPTPWLDGKHAIFGEVIEGMNVVEKIGSTQTDSNDRPLKEVVVKSMKLV